MPDGQVTNHRTGYILNHSGWPKSHRVPERQPVNPDRLITASSIKLNSGMKSHTISQTLTH